MQSLKMDNLLFRGGSFTWHPEWLIFPKSLWKSKRNLLIFIYINLMSLMPVEINNFSKFFLLYKIFTRTSESCILNPYVAMAASVLLFVSLLFIMLIQDFLCILIDMDCKSETLCQPYASHIPYTLYQLNFKWLFMIYGFVFVDCSFELL